MIISTVLLSVAAINMPPLAPRGEPACPTHYPILDTVVCIIVRLPPEVRAAIVSSDNYAEAVAVAASCVTCEYTLCHGGGGAQVREDDAPVHAEAQTFDFEPNQGDLNGSSYAFAGATEDPVISINEIIYDYPALCPVNPGNPESKYYDVWPFGFAQMKAKALISFTIELRGSWSGAASVEIQPITGDALTETVTRTAAAVSFLAPGNPQSALVYELSSANGMFLSGLTAHLDGSETADIELDGGSGEHTLSVVSLRFSDKDLDVNGDGRFNALDVDALTSFFGKTDCPDVEILGPATPCFDFNHDGVIDETDADYLQFIVDLGLDSGTFGDLDRNGVVDWCDWLNRPTGGAPAALGSSDYRIELDANVDGLVGSSEWAAFQAAATRVDFNQDGVVNSTDASDFVNAYFEQDPSADWNGDSVINSTDVSDYNNDWFAALACE
jgi:hypothetical protein